MRKRQLDDLLFTIVLSTLILLFTFSNAQAQTTAFTYQGKLTDGGNLANAAYDMQFKLFDAATNGNQIGATLTFDGAGGNPPAVVVSSGIFAVNLDFGAAALSGADRFLEILLKPAGNPGGYQQLLPRQRLTSTPFAVQSLNAANATNATTATNAAQLGGVAASQYVITSDARLSDARAPTAGSTNYIQNTTSPQAASNFNISGNGTAGGALAANIVNATAQVNLGGQRMLFVSGAFNDGSTILAASNTFLGENAGVNTTPNGTLNNNSGKFNTFMGANAGLSNTTGFDNAFFGASAGFFNTTGESNAFFGRSAGSANTTGSDNAFFGAFAGQANTTGSDNAFFGWSAGSANTTGFNNAFFGVNAGQTNFTGIENAFFGRSAGSANTTGSQNAFFGQAAGQMNTTGGSNAFFSASAGLSNTTGSNNTIIGRSANVGAGNLTNATAIGALAQVNTSNSLVLGSINGVNGATADTLVGIATTAPLDRLHVAGNIRVGTGTTGCVRDADATVIAGTCSSDARLKRNITPFANLLNKLTQLQPVTFHWRSEEFKERHFGTTLSFGLIAQEVEKVLPELVTEDEQGYKAVNYSKLPLLTLQAIKELKAENDALRKENAAIQQQQQKQFAAQQSQLAAQQAQLAAQQQQLEALKNLIYATPHKAADGKAKRRR